MVCTVVTYFLKLNQCGNLVKLLNKWDRMVLNEYQELWEQYVISIREFAKTLWR